MAAKPGYRMLRIDLSENKVNTEQLDDKMLRKYLGGSGLAAKVIWDETNKDTDPLSEENRLVFAAGLLTVPGVPHSSRGVIAALSPETGIWGESRVGGNWPALLMRAGYLAVAITGKAKKPVYLWVKDDEAKIVDASHVWGKTIFEAEPILKKETDEKASVAAIGPAGEKLVRIANVIFDGAHGHAAGRCGLGAVMGSKNLKAVVVKGTGKPAVYDREKLTESVAKHFPPVHALPGGVLGVKVERHATVLFDRGAIKNFQLGSIDNFSEKMNKHLTRPAVNDPCLYCRTGCAMSRLIDGKRMNHAEVMIPMGSNCLINDMEALDRMYDMVNGYGMDSITSGDLIAFAMECYEKGLITKSDTGGIDLTWGNADAALQLLEKIANREGFGEVLGEGMLRAVKKIGGQAGEYAIHVKGLGLTLHDPRASNAHALQNATCNRGGDAFDGYPWLYRYYFSPGPLERFAKQDWIFSYLSENGRRAAVDRFAVAGMGELVALAHDFGAVLNSLTLCWFNCTPWMWNRTTDEAFPGTQPEHWADWLHWVTGWDNINGKEIRQIGERIFNLQRLINVRKGISRKDDFLPPRLLTSKRGGPSLAAENIPPLETMLKEYYLVRGWSEEGIPTKEKLVQLAIP